MNLPLSVDEYVFELSVLLSALRKANWDFISEQSKAFHRTRQLLTVLSKLLKSVPELEKSMKADKLRDSLFLIKFRQLKPEKQVRVGFMGVLVALRDAYLKNSVEIVK